MAFFFQNMIFVSLYVTQLLTLLRWDFEDHIDTQSRYSDIIINHSGQMDAVMIFIGRIKCKSHEYYEFIQIDIYWYNNYTVSYDKIWVWPLWLHKAIDYYCLIRQCLTIPVTYMFYYFFKNYLCLRFYLERWNILILRWSKLILYFYVCLSLRFEAEKFVNLTLEKVSKSKLDL